MNVYNIVHISANVILQFHSNGSSSVGANIILKNQRLCFHLSGSIRNYEDENNAAAQTTLKNVTSHMY
jgi:hypothetical protein